MFTNTNRITGFSGFDTDTMVKSLMQAESVKYTNMLKKATFTTYRQEAYRSVASTLSTFQSSLLSLSSSSTTSIRLSKNFVSSTATATLNGASTSGIKVSAGTTAKAGNYTLEVQKIAQKDKYTGDVFQNPSLTGASGIKLESLAEAGEQNLSFSFNVSLDGASAKTITLTADEINDIMPSVADDDAELVARFGASWNDSLVDEAYAALSEEDKEAFGEMSEEDIKAELETKLRSELNAKLKADIKAERIADDNKTEILGKVEDLLNEKLTAAFGNDALLSGQQKVTASIGADGKLTLESLLGHTATITGNTAVMTALGTTSGQKTGMDTSRTLDDIFGSVIFTSGTAENKDQAFSFVINGKDFTFNRYKDDGTETTLDDVMNKVNSSAVGVTMSYDQSAGKFSLESNSIGAVGTISFSGGTTAASENSNFFRAMNIGYSSEAVNNSNRKDAVHVSTAQDAEVRFNGGEWVTRESNSFAIEGINFTLNENSVSTVAGETKKFDINIGTDVSKVKELITNFITEYNNLIDSLNSLYRTSRPKSTTGDYFEPLTDEEKSGMTEAEIKSWEEQAKKGLLHRDSIVENILTDLRRQMTSALTLSDGSTISLSSIGITTSDNYNDGGKLVIKDEAKLNAALETRGNDVSELFTRSATDTSTKSNKLKTEGLSERLNDIINNATAYNGPIAKKAGLEGGIYEKNNTLYNDLVTQNEKISQMLTYLQRREEYYYNMFSKMEAAMVKADDQLASIQSILGA